MSAQLIAWWLLVAPLAQLGPAEGPQEAAEEPADSEYAAAKIALGEQISKVDSDESSLTLRIQGLRQAMAELEAFPQDLPNDEDAQRRLDQARLWLVWLYLSDRNKKGATEAMDAALRASGSRLLELALTFGPRVVDLHNARKEALEAAGRAVIEADCGELPCELIVESRRAANPSAPLYLGTYEVWVGARDGSAWERHEVVLDTKDAVVPLVFEAGVPEEVPVEIIDEPEPIPMPVQPKRKLPRWAELLGVGAGVGLAVSGALMIAYAGRCQDGSDPREDPSITVDDCPTPYSPDMLIPGAVLTGVGGALLLTSTVLFTVDEVRVGGRKGRQAMLRYTLRF